MAATASRRRSTAPSSASDKLDALLGRIKSTSELPATKRIAALGNLSHELSAALAVCRQDTALELLDELTTSGPSKRVGPLSRTLALRLMADQLGLSRTAVFSLVLAAERRAGRPKQAPGRPRRKTGAESADGVTIAA
jgi:hypothetical protein